MEKESRKKRQEDLREEAGRTNKKVKAAIIFMAVMCLAVLLIVRCRKYAQLYQELQAENEKLTEMLADKDEIIDACEDEIERILGLETLSMEEHKVSSGFLKKGDVYLIDNSAHLWKLKGMIEEGAEIEPGVAAADASYRLRTNITIDNWFFIGTEEMPFCGNFDGDGHWISGKFPFAEGENVAEAFFKVSDTAKIENLTVHNSMNYWPLTDVHITVEDDKGCGELENNLAVFPDCCVRLEIGAPDLDTGGIAGSLRDRWERNQGKDGYFVSVSFYPHFEEYPETDILAQKEKVPFDILASREYGDIIEKAMEQEDGYLRFLKLERIGEMICCSFEIGELDPLFYRPSKGYHIILDGKWEGEEITGQHFYIPYTDSVAHSIGTYSGYTVEDIDINFDGRKDLLIHEGYSSGSGGSWENYRAVVWEEQSGQFVYYPSFPEALVSLEFDRQRVVTADSCGAGYEEVTVYGVVNGEYVCTRKLVHEYLNGEEGQDYVEVLSYYEMDELVRIHILSDWTEMEELYPDMNYWRNG